MIAKKKRDFFGGRNQWKGGGEKEKETRDEYDRSKSYIFMKIA
jgi:hypothetical protein